MNYRPNSYHEPHAIRDFTIAMRLLIDLCVDVQARGKVGEREKQNLGNYVREMCTVRIAGPRQVGHSTAMCTLGKKLFEKPLFVYPNASQAEDFARMFDLGGDVCSFGNLPAMRTRMRGRSHDAVLVDGASRMSGQTEVALFESIWPFAAERDTFCVVLVQ